MMILLHSSARKFLHWHATTVILVNAKVSTVLCCHTIIHLLLFIIWIPNLLHISLCSFVATALHDVTVLLG